MSEETAVPPTPPGPVVYVAHHDGRMNISDAARFGEVRIVFRRVVYPDNVDEQMTDLLKHAQNVMMEFSPKRDFLCLVGSPLYIAMCSYVITSMRDTRRKNDGFKLLRYDKLESQYYPISMRK